MLKSNEKYPIEKAAEEAFYAIAHFFRRKHNMADALEIVAFISLFIAIILRGR